MMARFSGSGRHQFLNDTQVGIFHQMPAIAVGTPAIMFHIFAADCGRLGFCLLRHTVRLMGTSVVLVAMGEPSNPTKSSDPKRELLRHTLATLAYRGGKTLRDAPANFSGFSAGHGLRSPGEILAHIGDLLDWALSIAMGQQKWHNSDALPWEQGTERFFAALERLDAFLASGETVQVPMEKLFQGPIADALTHVGQIAILRRMAGAPVKGENYFVAEIEAGRVGADQAKPKREF